MLFVNLTPHAIVLNDGTTYPVSGTIARVSVEHTGFNENGICFARYGEVTGLPTPTKGVVFIVSAMVGTAAKGRCDIVAPATGHPECRRNDKGQIISVPGFIWCN